jgi:hypothetical protein
MLMGEPVSAGLRRTDKSVLNDRGVKIDTNDDTARVYPSRVSEDGSGEVERRENAIAQQKSVSNACSIVVFPDNVAFGVIRSRERRYSARKINRGERPMGQQVSVTHSTAIRVRTDDCARSVHRAGTAADCAGRIETKICACKLGFGRPRSRQRCQIFFKTLRAGLRLCFDRRGSVAARRCFRRGQTRDHPSRRTVQCRGGWRRE